MERNVLNFMQNCFYQNDFQTFKIFSLKSNKCAKFDALPTAFSSLENTSLELKLFS